MASTAEGRRLTEEHRQAQVALKRSFLAQFVPLWPLLSWPDLDRTAVPWVRAAMKLIRVFRQDSAELSAGYYRRFRNVEVPAAPPLPAVRFPVLSVPGARRLDAIEPYNLDAPAGLVVPETRKLRPVRVDWASADEAAGRSLLVTGPGELKRRAARGEPEERAKSEGLRVASAAASRQVLTGGRQTTLTLLGADDTALGWARVTDSDPCAFCALLASRGPVYRSPTRASFQAHDGCACTAEAVYTSSAGWPGRAREFERLYRTSTRGHSGKGAINAFRRAHDAQRRAAAEGEPLSA